MPTKYGFLRTEKACMPCLAGLGRPKLQIISRFERSLPLRYGCELGIRTIPDENGRLQIGADF